MSILKVDSITSRNGGEPVFPSGAKGIIYTPDGSVANPSWTFDNERGSGVYRIANNRMGIAVGGQKVGEFGVGYGGFTGNVIQVVSTTKRDTFTTTSTSFVDVTGLSVNITPRYSNSKIIIFASVSAIASGGNASFIRLRRNSTDIALGDASGSRTQTSLGIIRTSDLISLQSTPIMFEDSPNTTLNTTYLIRMAVQAGTGFVNRTNEDADITASQRSISTITVMEVQA